MQAVKLRLKVPICWLYAALSCSSRESTPLERAPSYMFSHGKWLWELSLATGLAEQLKLVVADAGPRRD